MRYLRKCPDEFKHCYNSLLPVDFGTQCRGWPAGKKKKKKKKDAEMQIPIEADSKRHNIVICMDDSVTRNQSGWWSTAMQGGSTVQEGRGIHSGTTSSLTMAADSNMRSVVAMI